MSVLFDEINRQVEHLAEVDALEIEKMTFESEQEEALKLFTALRDEFLRFRTNFFAMTEWWSEMVDEKEFVSKSGGSINVLESYLEKTK